MELWMVKIRMEAFCGNFHDGSALTNAYDTGWTVLAIPVDAAQAVTKYGPRTELGISQEAQSTRGG